MDHIWEAPSRLKKTLALIFLKILAIILRQDFLRTLYLVLFKAIACDNFKFSDSRSFTDFDFVLSLTFLWHGPKTVKICKNGSSTDLRVPVTHPVIRRWWMTRILASDWSKPGQYWPLIGRCGSRDLNTGLWLAVWSPVFIVSHCHVTSASTFQILIFLYQQTR